MFAVPLIALDCQRSDDASAARTCRPSYRRAGMVYT
jgi:hypothetical protein